MAETSAAEGTVAVPGDGFMTLRRRPQRTVKLASDGGFLALRSLTHLAAAPGQRDVAAGWELAH